MASVCNLRWKGTFKGAHSTMAENVYITATASMIGMATVTVEAVLDICASAEAGTSRQTRLTTPTRKTTTHFAVRSANIRAVFDDGVVPSIAGFCGVKIMNKSRGVNLRARN